MTFDKNMIVVAVAQLVHTVFLETTHSQDSVQWGSVVTHSNYKKK